MCLDGAVNECRVCVEKGVLGGLPLVKFRVLFLSGGRCDKVLGFLEGVHAQGMCWDLCSGVCGGVLGCVCKGGFLHSDVCGGGVGSSPAVSEYGSCRVCMEGWCIEVFTSAGCVRGCI